MFDIKEYFEEGDKFVSARREVVAIDDDITHDINNLISSRFDGLYLRERYKHGAGVIEILHPGLQYPGSNPLLMNPDRVRSLLSFYPCKSDLTNIDKIVMRPRYIEIGNIELASLYLRRKKILVLYLFHPHFYKMRHATPCEGEEAGADLGRIMAGGLMGESVHRSDNTDVCVHPLWYFLSVVSASNDDMIDKFFVKKEALSGKIYQVLCDISFYYSRHGY
jgi:hypothetical protein